MTRRDVLIRLAGLATCGGALAVALVQRAVAGSPPSAPASAIELGLAIASFTLMSAGVMLVIVGGALFERRAPPRDRVADRPAPDPRPVPGGDGMTAIVSAEEMRAALAKRWPEATPPSKYLF